MALIPLAASAVEITVDNIKYSVVKKAKHAEVISNGYSYEGDIVIPSTIEYEGVTCNVEAIAANAFGECSRLTSVTIPASVTSIGKRAFYLCSKLTSINIPDGVTVIEDETFTGCKLGSIKIPNGVTSIGASAFQANNVFSSVTIPNSVITIGKNAFAICKNLTSVKLGNSVTSIGESAFSETPIETISIPASVVSIGRSAFSYTYLKSIILDKNVSYIGEFAFYVCPLEYVKLGGNVQQIGSSAFRGCELLSTVVMENGLSSIGLHAFRGCIGLGAIDIPSSVTTIGDNAFQGCTSLKSVGLHDGLQSLGGYAFYGCSSLLSVTLPNTLTKIGSDVYTNCSHLTTVVVPKDLEKLGSGMFSNCEELTDVYCLSTTGVECNSYTFENSEVGYATLHVPAIVLDLYKKAPGWRDFGTIVALKSGDPGVASSTGTPIVFDDYVTNALCLQFFDANGDLQVSRQEAAAVKAFPTGQGFSETAIASFDEFRFFTGIRSIPQYGFGYCQRLKHIMLPEGLLTIGNGAFISCTNLNTVIISSTVTNIGVQAFINCDNLKDVYCLAPTPPNCDFEAFEDCKDKTLHVPAASINLYRNSGMWGEFGEIVVSDMTTTGISDVNAASGDAPVYTLGGLRVKTAKSGVFVKAGHKVVVR